MWVVWDIGKMRYAPLGNAIYDMGADIFEEIWFLSVKKEMKWNEKRVGFLKKWYFTDKNDILWSLSVKIYGVSKYRNHFCG